MRGSVRLSHWLATGPWEKVAIKNRTAFGGAGSSVFTREQTELEDDKIYILNEEGRRVRWAGLDRCSFYSEIPVDEDPEDEIPELE